MYLSGRLGCRHTACGLLAVAVMLASAATASAASVEIVVYDGGSRGRNAELQVRGSADADRLTVRRSGTRWRVTSAMPLTVVGPDCERLASNVAECPRVSVAVRGGPGDDDLLVDDRGGPGYTVALDGGPGDDRVQTQNFGAQLLGGHGRDVLIGGRGPQNLRGDAGTPESDVLVGGAGTDTVVYRTRFGIHADLHTGRVRQAGAVDRLEDIENVIGGDGPDVLRGDAGPNFLEGGTGADVLDGRAGPDRIAGGGLDRRVDGGSGNDLLFVRGFYGDGDGTFFLGEVGRPPVAVPRCGSGTDVVDFEEPTTPVDRCERWSEGDGPVIDLPRRGSERSAVACSPTFEWSACRGVVRLSVDGHLVARGAFRTIGTRRVALRLVTQGPRAAARWRAATTAAVRIDYVLFDPSGNIEPYAHQAGRRFRVQPPTRDVSPPSARAATVARLRYAYDEPPRRTSIVRPLAPSR